MAFASWGWVTALRVRAKSPEDLVGQSFNAADTYKDGYGDPNNTKTYTLGFHDGGKDGKIGHQGSPGVEVNDRIDIDGQSYDISRHWSFDVRITYDDGTTLDTQLMGIRVGYLKSGTKNSGDHTGATVFRVHDSAIDSVFEGPDGDGANQYSLDEIEGIEILGYAGAANDRRDDVLDDPYPDDHDDADDLSIQGPQEDEVPPPPQGPQEDEVPPPPQGPQEDEVPPPPQGPQEDEVPPPPQGPQEEEVPPPFPDWLLDENLPDSGDEPNSRPPREAPVQEPQEDEVPPPPQGPQEEETPPSAPCLAAGTMVETIVGQRPVETLQRGDLVKTMDNGYRPICWAGSVTIEPADLIRNPRLRPVLIRRDALGQGLPACDLLVSRQHRLFIRSEIARRMFGADEILIPAIRLVGCEGIEVAEEVESVTYWHLLFDRHEVIFTEGAPTESLYTGPVAMNSISPAARQEIEALFPEITAPDFVMEPVRRIVQKDSLVNPLIMYHAKEAVPLFSPAGNDLDCALPPE